MKVENSKHKTGILKSVFKKNGVDIGYHISTSPEIVWPHVLKKIPVYTLNHNFCSNDVMAQEFPALFGEGG